EAKSPGRYPLPTVAQQDFWALVLPTPSSCGATSPSGETSYCGTNSSFGATSRFDATRSCNATSSCDTTRSCTVPVQTSPSLRDGSPVQRSEPAHQASLSFRDCSLPSTSEQSAEVSARQHDF
ncbi:unnamed protein product, partial [Ixodes persulcatus]